MLKERFSNITGICSRVIYLNKYSLCTLADFLCGTFQLCLYDSYFCSWKCCLPSQINLFREGCLVFIFLSTNPQSFKVYMYYLCVNKSNDSITIDNGNGKFLLNAYSMLQDHSKRVLNSELRIQSQGQRETYIDLKSILPEICGYSM